PRDIDEVIELYKHRASSRFSGHSLAVIVDLIEAISEAKINAPVHLTIPTSAPPRAIAAALDRLYTGPLRGCATIAIEHAGEEGIVPIRYGSGRCARHEVRLERQTC